MRIYFKKAEEILWRMVFYEIIHIIKSNKKNLKSNTEIEIMYKLHLSSAYGFYNHLVLKFQTEFNSILQLDGFLDYPLLTFDKPPLNKEIQENGEILKDLLTRILHKFLICLGDLARYQIEYDPAGCTKLAYKYYQKSLILLPSNGISLNQLGTLFGSENYGCDAAYYYLYCLNCTDPFLSAKENLKILFSKNRKRFEEIKTKKFIDRNKLAEYQLNELRNKEIKKFLVTFLYVIDLLLSQSTQIDNQNFQELCQLCLQEYNSCMFYRKLENTENKSDNMSNDKLYYLSDELVFKLTVIILMTIENLKSNKRAIVASNSPKTPSSLYFTSVAFALVFFSHIVNHTIIRIQESLLGHYNKNKALTLTVDEEEEHGDLSESKESNETDSSSSKTSHGEEKSTKKRIKLIYGLRRRKHNSDSDTDDSEDSNNSNQSEKKNSNYDNDNNEDVDDDDEEGTVVQSSSGSSCGRRHNKKGKKSNKDRDNLSETELNAFSEDDSESSELSADSSTGSEKRVKKEKGKIVSKKEKSTEPIKTLKETHKANKLNESLDNNVILPLIEQTKIDLNNQINYLNNTSSINFKEFSYQLFSSFSMGSQDRTAANMFNQGALVSGISNQSGSTATTDEFIDNEIYKFVLNGKKQVDVPPGFDSKEALEIEELGKKIATFQIETDTEMSILNSDGNSSNDDFDNSDESDTDKKKKKKEKTSESKNLNKPTIILDQKNAKIMINVLQYQSLLPTIKVFCDWLLCNKKIIQSISQVSITLWSKLAILLNSIPLEKQIANQEICENEYVRNLILRSSETKSWNCQPLPEDVHLRSFNALKLEHISLKFDINKLNQLSLFDEHLLRLCNLRRFGYLIASLSKAQSSSGGTNFFFYEVNRAAFLAPITNSPRDTKTEIVKPDDQALKDDSKKANEENQANVSAKENRKFQLMKSMAQLRLEAEISQLESLYKSDESQWSPYLVPDTWALCHNLKIFQELSRTNKFIIIISLVVIDHLDSIKKDSRFAREVIRWLEGQFKQGNRFLRAQNHNEKISNNYDSNLKKKDLDTWRMYQLIDCCKYFQQESSKNNDKNQSMVTLLVNKDETTDKNLETKYKSALNTAKQYNINVVNIKEFYEKYNKPQNQITS